MQGSRKSCLSRIPIVAAALAQHPGGCPLIDLAIELAGEEALVWSRWLWHTKGPWEVFSVQLPEYRQNVHWIIGEHDSMLSAEELHDRAMVVAKRRGNRRRLSAHGARDARSLKWARRSGHHCYLCYDLPHRRRWPECPVCHQPRRVDTIDFDATQGLGGQPWTTGRARHG